MRGEKNKLTIGLVIISAVLLIVVLYLLVIGPAINGYAVKAENYGVTSTLNAIISQVQQNGYVQIPAGNNQTLILIPYRQNTTAG